MNTIAFTLCSNNYLAFAKTLGDSYIKHHPKSKFIIGIVDKRDNEIDYTFFNPHELVFVEEIVTLDIDKMVDMYNIIEFNTAVKPSYFAYLFKKFTECDSVIYFDPDIKCYESLAKFQEEMQNFSIGLTPHITTPVPTGGSFELENRFLNFGLYNLGFLWLNRTDIAFQFLNWWTDRLEENCKADLKNGIFVDQLWVNFAPIFYKKDVLISYDLGMNMAHWNFHERALSFEDNHWIVNQKTPLRFYHFSGFKVDMPDRISKRNKLNFTDRPDVIELFKDYRDSLIRNKHFDLCIRPYQYGKQPIIVKPTFTGKLRTSLSYIKKGIQTLTND
jgi:hypothetical protein